MFRVFIAFVIFGWLSSPAIAASRDVASDPMRPDGFNSRVNAAPVIYKLNSVLLGGARKIAVINGKTYLEGDSFKLGRITSIDSDRVVIYGAKKHVLTFGSDSVKHHTSNKFVDKK